MSSATRNRPYSLSFRPIFTARMRIATLCSLLPVKYCMAAPKHLGRQRAHVHLQAFVADLGAGLVLAAGQHFLHARVGGELLQRATGEGPVTSRSRSPTVSRPRRRLPAGMTESTPGTWRSNSASSSAMFSA